jgi:ketopantoate reductase
MLVDWENGRELEIEVIVGNGNYLILIFLVIKLADSVDCHVPCLRTIYALIKLRSEINIIS